MTPLLLSSSSLPLGYEKEKGLSIGGRYEGCDEEPTEAALNSWLASAEAFHANADKNMVRLMALL